MPADPLIAAIDIGGTSIKSALFTRELRCVVDLRVPTPQHQGPEAVLAVLERTLTELVHRARQESGQPPAALGLASLGLVDERRGQVVYSSAVGWRDVPLTRWLQDRLPVPVALGHDIRAAARAEAARGAGRDAQSMLFVAIGTGIGAASWADGHPLLGARSRAGELGHLPTRSGDRRCGCGALGCLEAYASAAAIASAGSVAAGRPVTASEVAAAAASGLDWAEQVWRTAIEALADGLVCAAVLLDPALIVIGGGLSLAGAQLLDPLRRAVADRYPFADSPPIVPAELGDHAALVGAALLANELLANELHADQRVTA